MCKRILSFDSQKEDPITTLNLNYLGNSAQNNNLYPADFTWSYDHVKIQFDSPVLMFAVTFSF